MNEMVGPYRVIEELGRGGMGIVHRGVHDRLERQVAIKQLSPALTSNPHFRDRFFSEAKTQAKLQHPNIVAIYDLLEEGGDYFIVMEYFAGRGLDEVLDERDGRGLPLDESLGIFRQVLEALDCAHSLGVIHRDVKPSNVLIGDDARVQLMDFGIALLVGDKRLTQSSQTIGTPIYMSPEQILRPRELDHRTDIYSAAVMLFEMLAGRPPYDAETEYEIKKLHLEAPPAVALNELEGLAPQIRRALGRALAKEPADRFASAREFLRALSGEEDPPAPPAETPGASGTATRLESRAGAAESVHTTAGRPAGAAGPELWRRPAVLAGGGGVLAVLLVFALVFAFSGGEKGGEALREPSRLGVSDTGPGVDGGGSGPVGPALAGSGGKQEDRALRPAANVAPSVPGPVAEPRPQATRPQEARPQVDLAEQARRRAEREAEIQRRLVGETRQKVAAATSTARRQLAEGSFDQARDTVQRALSQSAPYRSELVDEVVALQLLAQEITDHVVARKSRQEKDRLAREAWERRIAEVAALIEEGRYPEARQLAEKLLQEEGVPPDLAATARELEDRARQELKNVWGQTKVEESTTVVNPRRKKKRGGG